MLPLTSARLTHVAVALLQLLAPLIPIVQPLANLGLEAAVGGLVKSLRAHAFGPVILPGEGVIGVMVIGVALAVADVLHEACRRVEDVHRRDQRTGLLGRAPGLAGSNVGGVRFGGGGEIEAGLNDRQLAFGGTEEIEGLPLRQA